MIKNTWKTLSLLAFCGAIVLANPADAKADEVPDQDSVQVIISQQLKQRP